MSEDYEYGDWGQDLEDVKYMSPSVAGRLLLKRRAQVVKAFGEYVSILKGNLVNLTEAEFDGLKKELEARSELGIPYGGITGVDSLKKNMMADLLLADLLEGDVVDDYKASVDQIPLTNLAMRVRLYPKAGVGNKVPNFMDFQRLARTVASVDGDWEALKHEFVFRWYHGGVSIRHTKRAIAELKEHYEEQEHPDYIKQASKVVLQALRGSKLYELLEEYSALSEIANESNINLGR